MKGKKLIALLLTGMMLTMTACGSGDSGTSGSAGGGGDSASGESSQESADAEGVKRFDGTTLYMIAEQQTPTEALKKQLDLFTDYAAEQAKQEAEAAWLAKEKSIQKAMLSIKKKYGKNAILKGMNLEDGATAKDRNGRIGGHKA